GSYEFTGLTPGDYSVQFVLPLGSEYSPLNASGDEATDSDADPAMSGMTEVVTLVSGQTNDDLDAGLYEPASIGDFVWLDEDGDGVQDDGEEGVEGVTVNLKDENGNVIASTTTGSDGSYEFTGLTPGDYSVQFVLPANNTFSPLNASGDEANDSDADPSMGGMTEVVTLTSGQTNNDLDAGLYTPASIGDFVWLDTDADGVQDAGEEGIEGVAVNLKDENGDVIASTTTEADGSYEFTGLAPGDYSVQFVLPAGSEYSPLNASGNEATDSDADPAMAGMTEVVTLASGETNDDLDAGLYEPASIGDYVWLDADADGIQDDGEEGIGGVTVSLTDENGNPVEDVDGNVVAAVQTNGSGFYEFTNLVPGDYIVVFETPEGLQSSPSNQGGDDSKDSDADETTGESPVVNLESGENDPTIDAGFYAPASIGDFVFLDDNGNGIQDPGEIAVANVTVNLKDENGNTISTTSTNGVGKYEFTGLTPGTYSVQFVLPLGRVFSPVNQGGNEANDSDADPSMGGMTEVVTLTSGQTNNDLDAGLYTPASIGDFVWLDTDADGVQDNGEQGIEGVTVNLKDVNGDVIASTTTGSDGSYAFTGLAPGDYSVQFVLPAGSEYSPLNASGDEATDSDADPAMGGMTEVVTLTSGETNDDLDAGLYESASIGDYVWLDADADGIQDDGEEGIGGVTVSLTDENGNPVEDVDG
ncbi:SdrD B-like domain-containing protein, partial [Portibacter marinus]|uniref:SdrD B-like domain-containing protein n=1 Tax=Portibacter marinus TaxID=2898660 RepID=UPI001F369791